MQTGRLAIGTSGYQYDHWLGVFYPRELPKRHWFGYYAERFPTVEINNTFYSLPRPETIERWREAAPEGFLYALKFSRFGSHVKRLKNPHSTQARFLDVARLLGESLGPVLVQLPPHWRVNPSRLDRFLAEAANDLRWAVEFRDSSWLCEEVFTLLRKYGVALCVHDMIPDHPRLTTANWVYMRFHGDHYTGAYSDCALDCAAEWLRDQQQTGRDIFAYFNNDIGGNAVVDARRLAKRLGLALGVGNVQ